MVTLEDIDKRRKRLIYRSWHRGTREMDLILGRFADKHIGAFSESELDQYETILTCSDPDLYGWVTGREAPPANIRTPVLERLLADQH
ncbi:MAG TPA: succinate dehydrogenase assembly factor 2 [Patescibacteria group bacterium]|jgi:antitoxin CptB|nr:succinate dehydrogenase assembly factor 2 [Patescibacteria group bacterium]